MTQGQGVGLDAKRVERAAEALGQQIDAAERSGKVFACVPPSAPTLYLGIDGTGVPVRASETAARAGKQPDGSAKTREAKLITAWTAESRHPKTGRPQRDPGSVSYCGAIKSAASRDTDPQPSACAGKPSAAAYRKPSGAPCSATEPCGFGRPARNVPRRHSDRRSVARFREAVMR